MRRHHKILSLVASGATLLSSATFLSSSVSYAAAPMPLIARAPVYILAQPSSYPVFPANPSPVAQKSGDRILANLEKENRTAAQHYASGQWEETIIAFESLIKRYPHSQQAASAYFFIAESHVQTGDFESAYNAYQTFIARNPKHLYLPRATFRLGEAAFRLGRTDQALRMLEIYVRDYPQDSLCEYALAYLGEVRIDRNEPQLAQRALETALQLYPDSHLANQNRFVLGKSFQQQGADAEALRFYRAIANESGNPLLAEAELQMATIHLNRHDLPAAQGHLLTALNHLTDPAKKSEAAYWLARTYVAEENHARAYELLQTAADSRSNPSQSTLNKSNQNQSTPNQSNEKLESAICFDAAIAALKLKKTDATEQWLDRLLADHPDSEWADDALHLKIDLARKSGKPTAQIDQLASRFTSEYPHSHFKADVLETAGRTAYDSENFTRSIKIFQQLLADDIHVDETKSATDRANWLYLTSLNQLGLKQFAAAETALQQIDFRDASDELKPLAHIALANARFGQQKFQSAIPEYTSFLRLAKSGSVTRADTTRVRTELFICFAETGRWAEAADTWRELKTYHPNRFALLETTSWLAEKSNQEKQFDLAAECYAELATPGNDPNRVASALSGLAWLKMETGDTTTALAAFERLIQECPDSPFTAAAAMVRAGAFADARDYPAAAQMYGVVVRRFDATEMAPLAGLRRAYCLQKIGTPGELQESRTLLIEYLARPATTTPARDEALYQLAWVQTDLSEPAASLESFEQLVANHPNSKYWPDAAFRVAKAAFDLKEFETATRSINQIVDRDNTPDSIRVRALFLRGDMASRHSDWESVRATMERLRKEPIKPQQMAKAGYWLAEALYRQQDYPTASQLLESLRSNKTLAESLQPWVCLRQAQCEGQQNHWSAAEKIATNGKQDFPLFAAHYEFDFVIARAMEQMGKLTDCRTVYQSVIDSPTGGATETAAISGWRIAETFFHQENYPRAIEAYHKVDAMFTYPHWRSAAMYQAGKCQEHLSNWQHAQKLYDRLIEQFPDSQYSLAAQKRLENVSRLAKAPATTQPETQSR